MAKGQGTEQMAKHNELVLLETRLAETNAKVFPELAADRFFQRDAVDTALRQRELTHQELDDGVVDGADDGGIDAIYIFLSGELVSDESAVHVVDQPVIELEIFQVKNETGFAETALQKLIDHLPELLALDATDEVLGIEFNQQIVERFGLFRTVYLLHASRMPRLSVEIKYISKATNSPNSKTLAKAARLRQAVLDDFPSAEVQVEFIGAPQLNVLARARTSETLNLKLAEQPISADIGGMVALVRLHDYFTFICTEDGKLRDSIFEENVRGYEGATNINKGIANSLKSNDPIDFWWLNNGVSIIGSRVQHAHKLAAIEDPQIVNGLQTSRAVYNHFADHAAPETDKRNVLVRIIEAADDPTAAQIIKATNSQNHVPLASLRAAEPFQRGIEEYLLRNGRYYERRRNHYKNQGVRRSEIVSVLELAQAVASISLALPHEARGRPSWLIRDPVYSRIFNDRTPLEFYLRSLSVMDSVETFLMAGPKLGKQERSNIRFHLARVAIAVGVTSSRPKPATVLKLDPDLLGGHLQVVYDWVVGERETAASVLDTLDYGTLAKSAEFSNRLNARLSRYSDKQKWPKTLDSGWAL